MGTVSATPVRGGVRGMFDVRHFLPLAADFVSHRRARRRLLSSWLCLSCALFIATAAAASAQVESSRLVVLRAERLGATTSPLEEEVDQALLHALMHEAGFADVYFSPTTFDDVRLLSGCDGSEGDCLAEIVAALGEDWVLVRDLSTSGADGGELTMFAQDGSDARIVRRAHARMPRSDASAVKAQVREVVRDMVRALYGQRAAQHRLLTARAAEATRTVDKRRRAALRGVAWSSFSAGAAVIATGIALGVTSNRAQDDYRRLDVREPRDVDRAERLLARSRQRATAANKCFIVGSSFAVAGVSLLLWDLVRPERASRSLTVSATPLPYGGALQLSGAIDRRL